MGTTSLAQKHKLCISLHLKFPSGAKLDMFENYELSIPVLSYWNRLTMWDMFCNRRRRVIYVKGTSQVPEGITLTPKIWIDAPCKG
jgi:hypothetical protein